MGTMVEKQGALFCINHLHAHNYTFLSAFVHTPPNTCARPAGAGAGAVAKRTLSVEYCQK